MGRKKIMTKLLTCFAAAATAVAGIPGSVPLSVRAVEAGSYTATFEARIGDTRYEKLEEAFDNAQSGDTIIVLKDCSVSKTLEVIADNITLTSGDAGNPAAICRGEEFSGKNYGRDAGNVLVGISSGSLATRDIILDGGAVLDGDFNNTGQVWDSPLIYVKGSYVMEAGTVLQNNYNTDYSESVDSNRNVRTAGALEVAEDGFLTMDGGFIRDCYTLGAGGGIQVRSSARAEITGGAVSHCYAVWGGALGMLGPVEITGMELYGNGAESSGGALWSTSELELSGCTVRDNQSAYDGGGASITANEKTVVSGCTFVGNSAGRGSAIHISGSEGVNPPVIRDCAITGNRSDAETPINGSAINYMAKSGLILDGEIVMDDNTFSDGIRNDIVFWYDDAEPVCLGESFTSTSAFKISGYEITSGKLAVDATTNGKETDAQQFSSCHGRFKTEEKGGDIYFTEIYRVLYFLDGKGYLDPETYVVGEPVTVLSREAEIPYLGSFDREDRVFDGWNTKEDGSGTDYGEGQEVWPEKTLYLYGKWKDKFTVTYDYNGGTGSTASAYSAPGYPAALPGAAREGYLFKGWFEDEGLKMPAGQEGEEYTAYADITLYAAWEEEAETPEERPEATVTFDADGGEMEGGDITAKVGSTIVLPSCTKEGYEFTGWYDGDTCVGQAGEDYTVAGDITLKAHYIRKEAPTCTVSFDTDGGKEISPMKVEKGKAVKLPEAEKEGHIFLGWYKAKEGGTRMGTELTVTEDTMLYARWEKESQKPEEKPEATVTFDADGGKMEGGDITAKVGDTITLPGCTKEGYEFVGWYDGDASVGPAGEQYTVTGDVTLKAHYEKKAEVTYLITFDPNGGRRAEPVKAAKGERITLPGTEKSGYVFLGWYTEKKGGILFGLAGDELEVAKDMTVYALWEKEKAEGTGDKGQETCKVAFHTEGGSLKNQTLTIVKGAGLYLPLPEKKGYDFTGWYLDKSLTQFAGAYRDSYRITKDTDFYAKWEKAKEEDKKDDNTDQGNNAETADTYTVKYDANGGTVKESSARVTKGKGVKLPAAEREGYAFTGWYTDKQILAGEAGAVYKSDRDICLYAGWKKVSDGNSGDNTNDTGKSSGTKTGASISDTGSKAGTGSSDAKTGTSTADTGSGGSTDKKSDTPVTGKSGNTAASLPGTGAEKEPVIQTGRTSPIYLLAAIGMVGVLLAALSVCEGKRSSRDKA